MEFTEFSNSLEFGEEFCIRHNEVLKLVRKVRSEYKEVVSEFFETTYINSRRRKYPLFLFSKKGTDILINTLGKSKGVTCNRITKKIGMEVIVSKTRFETSFINLLVGALEELGIAGCEQYNVLEYKIDFYIPKHNIAIEYDEKHHLDNLNKQKDKDREKEIKKILNCDFIRCNYEDSDIKNVMKVVKFILKKEIKYDVKS